MFQLLTAVNISTTPHNRSNVTDSQIICQAPTNDSRKDSYHAGNDFIIPFTKTCDPVPLRMVKPITTHVVSVPPVMVTTLPCRLSAGLLPSMTVREICEVSRSRMKRLATTMFLLMRTFST